VDDELNIRAITLSLQPLIKLQTMAQHQSSKKRIRQDEKKRVRNHFYKKTTRSAIKRLLELEDKGDAAKFLPKVVSMVDRLAKRNLWHKNKAGNIKSQLMKFVNAMG